CIIGVWLPISISVDPFAVMSLNLRVPVDISGGLGIKADPIVNASKALPDLNRRSAGEGALPHFRSCFFGAARKTSRAATLQ
ncbi:hypothetical protein, partial [Mixta calida]